MVGTWQDSSHFSSLNPPSFFKKKKKSWFSLIFISLFLLLLCPDSGTCTLSLYFPSIVSPRFSPTSMDTCSWKGSSADSPATLLLPPCFLQCTQDECSWWTREVKIASQARRQRSEPEQPVQQTWSVAGLATVFGHLAFTMFIVDAECTGMRACQCKCGKPSPHLLSLVLGFLTLIAL